MTVARQAGFTLLELLVVLLILGFIAAIATPQTMKYLDRSKVQAAHLQLEGLGTALELLKMDVDRYPTTEEGLQALIRQPPSVERWSGPYLKKTDGLTDPWGRSYRYRSPGEHGDFDLFSTGADGKDGNAISDPRLRNW